MEGENKEAINEERLFEGKEVRMEPVTEASMVQCAKCRFSKGNPLACEKYKMKPGAVILGEGECSFLRSR